MILNFLRKKGKTLAVIVLVGCFAWLFVDKFIIQPNKKPEVIETGEVKYTAEDYKNDTENEYVASIQEFNLKDIGELATQSGFYRSVQQITGSRQLFGVEVPGTKNRFIYSYEGTVKAGLNFDEVLITVNDETKEISAKLPPVRILDVIVDLDSLQVYVEEDNMFNPLKIGEYNRSMQEMQSEARQTALDHGILTEAKRNAEVIIKAMLEGMYPDSQYEIKIFWAN